jgi:hypothetical protein
MGFMQQNIEFAQQMSELQQNDPAEYARLLAENQAWFAKQQEAKEQAKEDKKLKNKIKYLLKLKPAIDAYIKMKGQTPEKKFIPKVVQAYNAMKANTLDPVTWALIVSAVVAFFVELIKAKKAGQTLPPELDKIAGIAVKADEKATEMGENEAKFMLGDFISKNIIFIALGILALILFLRK